MRVLGLLGLVVALAVVGVTVSRQLGRPAPAPAAAPGAPPIVDAGTAPAAQVQQYKKALEGALQAPRPEPESP